MHSADCKSRGQTLDPGGKVDGTLYMLFGTEKKYNVSVNLGLTAVNYTLV